MSIESLFRVLGAVMNAECSLAEVESHAWDVHHITDILGCKEDTLDNANNGSCVRWAVNYRCRLRRRQKTLD